MSHAIHVPPPPVAEAPTPGVGDRPSHRLTTPVLLAGLVLVATWIDLRFVVRVNPVDFLVYRYGSAWVLDGGDLYARNLFGPMMPDGGLPFTYPPFAALALWPTDLFTARTAYLVWTVGSLAVLAWVLDRFVPSGVRGRPLMVGAAFVVGACTTVVTEHVSFGQINLPLMGLVVADLTRRPSRWLPRGVLVGIAAAVKLTPGLFILFFLVTRQWRAAVWSLVGALGATVLGWVVLPAASRDFFTSVLFSLGDRVDLDGGLASYGNNSVTGVLAALGPGAAALTVPVLALTAAGVLGTAGRVWAQGRHTDAWVIVGLAAPLLSPVSWIHHWVWLLPAGVLIVARFRRPRQRCAAAVLALLLYLGPQAGQNLLDRGSGWMLLPGAVQREILLLTTVLAITLLARRPTTALLPSASTAAA